jgi:di/tricarboxylate transporter
MGEEAQSLLVLGGAIVLFMTGRVPVGLVALGGSLLLAALGILTVDQVLAGFADPVVLMIAALFIVAAGLDASGVTGRLGQLIMRVGGASKSRLLLVIMLTVAGLTALINVNGAVAALLPMVVLIGARTGRPGELLLPLAFAAHAGSLLTLTGTPVNLIIAEAARDSGAGAFGYFEFALVGIPLLVGTSAIILLLGPRLIPVRDHGVDLPDLSAHAATLAAQYDGSEHYDGAAEELITRDDGVLELVVSPRSSYIGMRVFAGMVTSNDQLVVLAISRGGEVLGPKPSELAPGDTLLLRGSWEALRQEEAAAGSDLLVVDSPDAIRSQAAPTGTRAWVALGIVGVMITLMVFGIVPTVIAAMLGAMAMVGAGIVTSAQAWRSVSWSTIVLIAGMIPVSVALTQTGAAGLLADGIVDGVGDSGTYGLLAGMFVITALLGQMISNTATALIMIPIGLSAAVDVGVDVPVVLMSIAVASAGSFLTPIATPANMMIQEPGGYRFGDYWKLGVPLLAWFFVIAVWYVPIVWG